jgi:hypothetical protein
MQTMIKEITPQTEVVNVSIPGSDGMKDIEVNFDELIQKEAVRIGHTYHNLQSQATYAIGRIESLKNDILIETCRLFDSRGIDTIKFQIDAMVHYLESEFDYVKDQLDDQAAEWFKEVNSRVYSLAEVAKGLLSLYHDRDRLEDRVKHLDYAKAGVVL